MANRLDLEMLSTSNLLTELEERVQIEVRKTPTPKIDFELDCIN